MKVPTNILFLFFEMYNLSTLPSLAPFHPGAISIDEHQEDSALQQLAGISSKDEGSNILLIFHIHI